jgi:hypothetical protein
MDERENAAPFRRRDWAFKVKVIPPSAGRKIKFKKAKDSLLSSL